MRAVLALLFIILAVVPAAAYPTTSNVIPTADMLEYGSLRIAFENDGAPRLFAHASESFLYLEYAPSPRLEVGANLYGLGDTNDRVLDAKWLAVSEAARRPALAVGALDVGSGLDPTTYAIATKDLGRGFRMHLGAAGSGGHGTLLLGVEQQVNPRDYLLADWESWDQGLATIGVSHDFGAGLNLNVAYGWPNDGDQARAVLFYVGWTKALREQGMKGPEGQG